MLDPTSVCLSPSIRVASTPSRVPVPIFVRLALSLPLRGTLPLPCMRPCLLGLPLVSQNEKSRSSILSSGRFSRSGVAIQQRNGVHDHSWQEHRAWFEGHGYTTIGTGAAGWFDDSTATASPWWQTLTDIGSPVTVGRCKNSWRLLNDRSRISMEKGVRILESRRDHVPYWHEGAIGIT